MHQLIKKLRLSRGMTQKELGKRLGYSSAQFVSNMERGTCGLPLKKIKKFCRVLKLNFTERMSLQDKMQVRACDKINKEFYKL